MLYLVYDIVAVDAFEQGGLPAIRAEIFVDGMIATTAIFQGNRHKVALFYCSLCLRNFISSVTDFSETKMGTNVMGNTIKGMNVMFFD
jgi:hypothetical protein